MIRGILAYKRISRWTLVLSIATMFALCLNILPSFHIASAATRCQGFIYSFDGAYNPSESNDGAGATINTMTPALCLNNETWSASYAWAMTAGQGSDEYAQSGYVRFFGYSTVYFFAEYDKNSSTPFVHREFGTASGTHTYDELYDFDLGSS